MPIFEQVPLFAFDPCREKARALRHAGCTISPDSTATWFSSRITGRCRWSPISWLRTRLLGVGVGVGVDSFDKAGIKRHNPKTNRRNRFEHYHGCLVIRVAKSAR